MNSLKCFTQTQEQHFIERRDVVPFFKHNYTRNKGFPILTENVTHFIGKKIHITYYYIYFLIIREVFEILKLNHDAITLPLFT